MTFDDFVVVSRHTDALIHEKVFGLEVWSLREVPAYTSRIEDAWSVWEWCLEQDEALVLRKADQYDRIANGQAGFIACRVDWYLEDWDDLTFGETVPLAICRAALALTREETP